MKSYVFSIGDARHPRRIDGAVYAKGEKSALKMIRSEMIGRGLSERAAVEIVEISGGRGRIYVFERDGG
jgi:hypothetical protein